MVTDPYLIVAIQALDGVSAAVLGVVLPLVVADITRGTGRFNLGLGIVGSAVGIGAAFSTTLGGYAMDHFGRTLAFSSLATIAACGLALLWLLPETRRVVGALASVAQTAHRSRAKGRDQDCQPTAHFLTMSDSNSGIRARAMYLRYRDNSCWLGQPFAFELRGRGCAADAISAASPRGRC